jgi:predicted acyl esterase
MSQRIRRNDIPFLMQRTPYSVWPYGSSNYPPGIMPGKMMEEKYIYVKQDVRGRHMSEGVNEEVTPYIPNKKSNKDVGRKQRHL